ncbi:MAG: ADP-ribosylglycohydrolase family protein, partial [Acidimicrobiia bacterium]
MTDRRVIDSQRAIGAVLGSAVGDALGAPFEFGPAGQYSARFPEPVLGGIGEMIGGGSFGWAPGEFTDDTQMAVVQAESIVANGGVDGADLFERFRVWSSRAADVGVQTRSVLHSGRPWNEAAAAFVEANPGRGAGNGSLMRSTPAAVH